MVMSASCVTKLGVNYQTDARAVSGGKKFKNFIFFNELMGIICRVGRQFLPSLV